MMVATYNFSGQSFNSVALIFNFYFHHTESTLTIGQGFSIPRDSGLPLQIGVLHKHIGKFRIKIRFADKIFTLYRFSQAQTHKHVRTQAQNRIENLIRQKQLNQKPIYKKLMRNRDFSARLFVPAHVYLGKHTTTDGGGVVFMKGVECFCLLREIHCYSPIMLTIKLNFYLFW